MVSNSSKFLKFNLSTLSTLHSSNSSTNTIRLVKNLTKENLIILNGKTNKKY